LVPVPLPCPVRAGVTFCKAIGLLTFCLVSVGSGTGCSSSVPTTPTTPTLDFTVSGYVYGQHMENGGEPLIADAVITARDVDGRESNAVTDATGFYAVRVRSGAVSIGASKAGYDASLAQEFTLSRDTVLNFSLLAASGGSRRSGSKRGLVHAPRLGTSWSTVLYTPRGGFCSAIRRSSQGHGVRMGGVLPTASALAAHPIGTHRGV
jgi:hypothetical protein